MTTTAIFGGLFQVAAVVWIVWIYLKLIRPTMGISSTTWRDLMMGIGLFVNIGALVAIPWHFDVHLHPIVLVGLGVVAFHAWVKFWLRRGRTDWKVR